MLVFEKYERRSIVEFMVAGGPNPWLIRSALLDKPPPCIPLHVVMVGVVVGVRKIADE